MYLFLTGKGTGAIFGKRQRRILESLARNALGRRVYQAADPEVFYPRSFIIPCTYLYLGDAEAAFASRRLRR